MIPLPCDRLHGWRWPFVWSCKAPSTKYLWHHSGNGSGDNPQVLLLCAKHYSEAIEHAVGYVTAAKVHGLPLALSHLIRDMGDI